MKLIVAQGNPEEKYAQTRHNIGFRVVEAFAKAQNVYFIARPKFHADIAVLTVGSEKVLLVKPTTYYNETGSATRALVNFYKLDPARDVLVIHDDLALPFGTIRTRERGSDAGNNGIKSLNSQIGEAYKRIRIGIWSDQRELMSDADFVLAKFSKAEADAIPGLCDSAHQIIDQFVAGSFDSVTQS